MDHVFRTQGLLWEYVQESSEEEMNELLPHLIEHALLIAATRPGAKVHSHTASITPCSSKAVMAGGSGGCTSWRC